MSDRFQPLRSQASLSAKTPGSTRALATPSPVDLTVLFALLLVVVVAAL